ncbi:MAG: metal-dependent hydrolase [Candidatus Acidiferrales bacterium]
MEPFTHALASVALARTRPKLLPRFGLAMLIGSGVAPDLDYASYWGGAGAFLRFHRTLFHSIPGAALTTCAMAAAFCALDKQWNGKTPQKSPTIPFTCVSALAVCAVGWGGHILLDLASGEGLQLLWPFRVHWTAWNLVANFDPWVLLLLIGGLLLPQLFRLVGEEIGTHRRSKAGAGTAIFTLLLLGAYLGARADLRSRAIDLLLSSEYRGHEPLAAGAFPWSANPLNWRGVVSTDNTMEELLVPLSSPADFNAGRSLTHYKPEESPALEAAEKTESAQRFLKYAEFPLASVGRREDGYRFELRDVRFPARNASPANVIVRVDLDSSLRVTREQYRYASSCDP